MSDLDTDEDSVEHFSIPKFQDEDVSLLKDRRKQTNTNKETLHGNKAHSKYPKSVFLILATEFCERFNYYGMKTILVIYLTEWLGLAYHSAVALFHTFSMLAYFSPLLGAIIADGYWGRFKTIFYVSMLYCLGSLIVSLTAFPPPEIYGPLIGLLLVSLGTGGIKPCVTAFGGDQFTSHQEQERMTFFSAFYFMINLGSMLSTFLTPILRADVHCIEKSCYPLAFGVPAILMFFAIVIFASGKKYYKQVPPTGNLVGRVVKCVGHGLNLRIKCGKYQGSDKHWLNYSMDKYEENFVEDVKSLLKVLWLFLPLPLFWALYDQQGSRWTLQAVDMNGEMGSLGRIKPDQIQVINPLLVLLLIPVFENVVYPCLNWLHIPNRPLQRMTAGMALCCLAFVVAGFVQLKMDNVAEQPLREESGMTFFNSVNCTVNVQSQFYSSSLPAYQISPLTRTSPGNNSISFSCQDQNRTFSAAVILDLKKQEAYRIVIADRNSETNTLSILKFPDIRKKDTDGQAKFSVISLLSDWDNTTAWIRPYRDHTAQMTGSVSVSLQPGQASNFTSLEPGLYQLFLPLPGSNWTNATFVPVEPVLTLGTGSVQTIILTPAQPSSGNTAAVQVLLLHFVTLKTNEVSISWQIPQYFVITLGEILFSITGLSFAYSQAPSSMKSVLQAVWHLCVAVGDLIVIIVAQTQLMPTQSAEYFMFAVLMGLDTLVFGVMAYFYISRATFEDLVPDTTQLISKTSDSEDVPLQTSASK